MTRSNTKKAFDKAAAQCAGASRASIATYATRIYKLPKFKHGDGLQPEAFRALYPKHVAAQPLRRPTAVKLVNKLELVGLYRA